MKIFKSLDDGLLKYSSTKLGLTDYDKKKTYDQEEKKLGLKEFGIMLFTMAGIIGIATILVLFVLT